MKRIVNMRDFKKTFFLFKKPAAHAQQGEYFVKAEKPRCERNPLPDQRPPPPRHPPFFTSRPPFHPFRQAVFAKQIQSFTVLKHWVYRYSNNSSNIIFTLFIRGAQTNHQGFN